MDLKPNRTIECDENKLRIDFSQHFSNTSRSRKRTTHHEFIEFHQPERKVLLTQSVGAEYLNHDHISRTQQNYQKLKQTSIVLPSKKMQLKNVQSLVKRARYRFDNRYNISQQPKEEKSEITPLTQDSR